VYLNDTKWRAFIDSVNIADVIAFVIISYCRFGAIGEDT